MFNYSTSVFQSLYTDKRAESSLPFFFIIDSGNNRACLVADGVINISIAV